MQLAEIFSPTPVNGTAVAGGIIFPFLAHVWGWLPGAAAFVAACFGIVWYALTIWEMPIVKSWRDARSARIRKARLAKLEAKIKIVQIEIDDVKSKITEKKP